MNFVDNDDISRELWNHHVQLFPQMSHHSKTDVNCFLWWVLFHTNVSSYPQYPVPCAQLVMSPETVWHTSGYRIASFSATVSILKYQMHFFFYPSIHVRLSLWHLSPRERYGKRCKNEICIKLTSSLHFVVLIVRDLQVVKDTKTTKVPKQVSSSNFHAHMKLNLYPAICVDQGGSIIWIINNLIFC